MIGISLLKNLYGEELVEEVCEFILYPSIRHLIHHIDFTDSGIHFAISSLIEQQRNVYFTSGEKQDVCSAHVLLVEIHTEKQLNL